MQVFQAPPATRFDLNFSLAGIPVRVHPLFWLMAVLFGMSTQGLLRLLIWVGIVFVSILAHELGHALAMGMIGQPSRIILHVAGGLTVPESISWGRGRASVAPDADQRIWITFAGPLTGFILAAVLLGMVASAGGEVLFLRFLGFLPLPTAFFPGAGSLVNFTITTLLWVNIFWGLLNLVPVYPLDGGNITRELLLKFDPRQGVEKSLWVSTIAGGILALAGLLLFNSLYLTMLFGLLAFQSYQILSGRSPGRF